MFRAGPCVLWTQAGGDCGCTRFPRGAEYGGWASEEHSSSVCSGAGTLVGVGCSGVSWNFGFVFYLSGPPLGPLSIVHDESEEDKKQDCTHVWSQTSNGAGALGLSRCGQTGVSGASGSCLGQEARGLGWEQTLGTGTGAGGPCLCLLGPRA